MNNEKWAEEVFESMKGSQRAKPRPELFANIENQIAASNLKVISLQQWRVAVAVAAVVLLVNVSAVLFYNQNGGATYEDVAVAAPYNQSLISNYQIYE